MPGYETRTRSVPPALAAIGALVLAGVANAQDSSLQGLPGRTIAYALSAFTYANYQTADAKAECPQGLNVGSREQFDAEFPQNGAKRTTLETHLKHESEAWFPPNQPDPLPFHEAAGPVAQGLNLDGKVGPHDFASPSGETGIDNQLYRATGCIKAFRGAITEESRWIVKSNYNRILIELEGVDNLVNAPDVRVTIYRGRDPLQVDANGRNILPGGTQRIDTIFGASLIQHLHGKISGGILTTEPADVILPHRPYYWAAGILKIRDMRLRLQLTPERAEGLLAGYTDVAVWYNTYMRVYPTDAQGRGDVPAHALYEAVARLADAYPDPTTGAYTAISSAYSANFVQVFIQHDAVMQTKTARR